MSIDEGYIKFRCVWKEQEIDAPYNLEELMYYRDLMYQKGWIGQYTDLGIGFGNISQKFELGAPFVISGTQTGAVVNIKPADFSLVTDYTIEENLLYCQGLRKASSESLTHAAIYALDKDIQAVIHIHDKAFWEVLLDKVPTTKANIPYGTPEMAYEIDRLRREAHLLEHQILTMAGHEEGIIAFGKDLASAAQVLQMHYSKYFS